MFVGWREVLGNIVTKLPLLITSCVYILGTWLPIKPCLILTSVIGWALQDHVNITGSCQHYRIMSTLQDHVNITGSCQHYRIMSTLQDHVNITGSCQHYRIMSTYVKTFF